MTIEKPIRDYLRDRCRELGWQCLPLIDPVRKGWPDRTIIGPDGRIAFVEVKAEGSKPNVAHVKRQNRRKKELRDLGHISVTVVGKHGVDRFFSIFMPAPMAAKGGHMKFYYIKANIDGRRRWHLAMDRGPGIFFVAADFEEDEYDIEDYRKEFPNNEVVEIPNVNQIKHPLGICDEHLIAFNRVDCPLCDFLYVYDRLQLAIGIAEDCLTELSRLSDVNDTDPDDSDEKARGRACRKLEMFLAYARVGLDGPCTCDEVGEGRCQKHGYEILAEQLRLLSGAPGRPRWRR